MKAFPESSNKFLNQPTDIELNQMPLESNYSKLVRDERINELRYVEHQFKDHAVNGIELVKIIKGENNKNPAQLPQYGSNRYSREKFERFEDKMKAI